MITVFSFNDLRNTTQKLITLNDRHCSTSGLQNGISRCVCAKTVFILEIMAAPVTSVENIDIKVLKHFYYLF